MFRLSDRVTIVGGVLQEYSVRLDGLVGIVTSSRYDAPAGTIAVYVYWDQSPYHDRVEELPKWVNVPAQFLQHLDDEAPEPEPTPTQPEKKKPQGFGGLRLVN